MTPQFDHEKLRAYQEALRFVGWADPVVEGIPAKEILLGVVSMVSGLIARFSAEVHEEQAPYGCSAGAEA